MRMLTPFLVLLALACGGAPSADVPPEVPVPLVLLDGPALPAVVGDADRPSDCPMEDASTFDSLLAADQPGASAPEVTRMPGVIVEQTRLADGTRVRVVRRGCAHFNETWDISPAPSDLVAGARAILEQVRMPSNPAIQGCLEGAPTPLPPDGDFSPKGDWSCFVGAEGGVLRMSYDFAL